MTSKMPRRPGVRARTNTELWFGRMLPRYRHRLLASFHSEAGPLIEMLGIAIFILLPVLRVALMLWTFIPLRNRWFGGAAALVLMIIAVSPLLNLSGG